MDSLQSLSLKASSEVDTEQEEDMQGIAGPSSLGGQNQRRRYLCLILLVWHFLVKFPLCNFHTSYYIEINYWNPAVLHVQLNGRNLTTNLWNRVLTWVVAWPHCLFAAVVHDILLVVKIFQWKAIGILAQNLSILKFNRGRSHIQFNCCSNKQYSLLAINSPRHKKKS